MVAGNLRKFRNLLFATNFHANYHLKPDGFINFLARLMVMKIKLFFEMIFQFRCSRSLEK